MPVINRYTYVFQVQKKNPNKPQITKQTLNQKKSEKKKKKVVS